MKPVDPAPTAEPPAWVKDGAPIWYHPHSTPGSPRYAGVIAGAVFDLGGTPCVYLREMEAAYGLQKQNPTRTTVPAAALHCVEPREPTAEPPKPHEEWNAIKRQIVQAIAAKPCSECGGTKRVPSGLSGYIHVYGPCPKCAKPEPPAPSPDLDPLSAELARLEKPALHGNEMTRFRLIATVRLLAQEHSWNPECRCAQFEPCPILAEAARALRGAMLGRQGRAGMGRGYSGGGARPPNRGGVMAKRMLKMRMDCGCFEECLGHCPTCGCVYEDGVRHRCPPGFLTRKPKAKR